MKNCTSFAVILFMGLTTAALAKTPLSLEVHGMGIISGQTNGALLEIGKQYRLSAKPARGQIFLNWQNNSQVISYDSALKFEMQEGLVLKATFQANPYPDVAGTYQGFLSNKRQPLAPGGILGPIEQKLEGCGALDLTVSKSGSFSGKVYLEFRDYSFSGKLRWPSATNATATIQISTTDPATAFFSQSGVNLDLVFDPATRSFSGVVSDWIYYSLFHQSFASQSDASAQICRVVPGQPSAGLFNFCLPPTTNQGAPAGYSFGSVKVSSSGKITGVINLADQTKPISFGAPLSENGQLRLFARSSDKKNLLMGWVSFTNQPGFNLKGENLTWLKSAGAKIFYTNGFKISCELLGSSYLPADFNTLNSPSNAIVFGDGNLSEETTNLLSFAQNRFSFPDGNPNQIKLTAKTATGFISGTMRPENASRPIPFRAIVLPAANAAYGYFLGTNQSSFVFLGPAN